MQKRGWIIILAACILTGILSGCGSSQEGEKRSIKIGVTLYDQYDTFVSQMMEQFAGYAGKKEEETGMAVNVEVYNAASSQSTQNSQVETMLKNGCDVICVNLVDRTAPSAIIDMAESADVPIIFFNRELVQDDLERWEKLYYVGAKAAESGTMEGEIAAEAFLTQENADKNQDGILQYVILEGEAGHQDTIVRTEYSVKALVKAGIDVEKLDYAIANWNRAQAQTKMTQLINEYGNQMELVLANNDDMALGAIDALKSLEISRERWPIIVGIDGTDVGLEAVKNKEMEGTIYNDKEGQAQAMVNLAYGLATDGDISYLKMEDNKYIRLPYTKVGEADVEKYIK